MAAARSGISTSAPRRRSGTYPLTGPRTLHAIIGPTSSGKTGRAIALAQQLRLPVIAIDRVQCFDDLATLSGRPSAHELAGTERWYLQHQHTTQQPYELDGPSGVRHLAVLLAHLPNGSAILEGGSMTLWRFLLVHPLLAAPRHRITLRVITDWDAHHAQVLERVQTMLHTEQPSLLNELAATLSHPYSRPFVAGLIGMGAVLTWCAARGITPACLPRYRGDRCATADLALQVAAAWQDYARQQQHCFRSLLANRTDYHEEIAR